LNWTIGGAFMRVAGVMVRVPKHILLPIVFMLTLTAIYVQEARMSAIWIAIGFGMLGYLMRRLDISPLPFVIAFILGGKLEDTARQAFAATGGDAWFLFTHPIAAIFLALAAGFVALSLRRTKQEPL
jgi:putative tricarboxylic transport membrane protein